MMSNTAKGYFALLVVFLLLDDTLGSGFCSPCKKVIDEIEEKGCTLACKALPAPLDEICSLIINKIGCEKIINWLDDGHNATWVCDELGMCGDWHNCPCGACVPAVYNKRCLSAPNSCPPSSLVEGEEIPTFTTKPLNATEAKVKDPAFFCFDGHCKASHKGCCLTCF